MPRRRFSEPKPLTSDLGSITGEFAVSLPAVALVIAVTLGAFGLQIERLKLVSTASVASRALGRGEGEDDVRDIALESEPNALFKIDYLEHQVCVSISKAFEIAGLRSFEVSERQCARKSGL